MMMMTRLVAVMAALALVLPLATAAGVLDLTSANFDDHVDGSRAVFVEFFAPWCGHCKHLAPVWEQLGETYASFKDTVAIAKVDADADNALGSRFSVSGFPTLKFFPKGSTTPEEYNGGRSIEDLVKFVNDKTGANGRVKTPPSDAVVLDEDNFDKIVMDPTKNVLVEFYAPWCGHCKTLAPIYEKLGTTYKVDNKEVVIAKMDADKYKTIPQRYGVSGFPTLKWFSKTDKSGEDYNGGRSETDLTLFVNSKTGLKRVFGGALTSDAGTIRELDLLAAKFGDESARDNLLDEAQKIADTSSSPTDAKYYVAVMKKVIANGNSFVSTELERIERIIADAKVKVDRMDDFYKRRNVLKAFKM